MMKLWTIAYDENKLDNFPQIMYKNIEIDIVTETKLINQIIKIFYLTNRDKKKEIDAIVKDKTVLPYKALHGLVFHPYEHEFQAEYLVDLLNMFNIEIDPSELEKE